MKASLRENLVIHEIKWWRNEKGAGSNEECYRQKLHLIHNKCNNIMFKKPFNATTEIIGSLSLTTCLAGLS